MLLSVCNHKMSPPLALFLPLKWPHLFNCFIPQFSLLVPVLLTLQTMRASRFLLVLAAAVQAQAAPAGLGSYGQCASSCSSEVNPTTCEWPALSLGSLRPFSPLLTPSKPHPRNVPPGDGYLRQPRRFLRPERSHVLERLRDVFWLVSRRSQFRNAFFLPPPPYKDRVYAYPERRLGDHNLHQNTARALAPGLKRTARARRRRFSTPRRLTFGARTRTAAATRSAKTPCCAFSQRPPA